MSLWKSFVGLGEEEAVHQRYIGESAESVMERVGVWLANFGRKRSAGITLVTGQNTGSLGVGLTDGNFTQMLKEYRGWVYKCVHRRAEDIRGVARKVQTKQGTNDPKDVDSKHPLARLLAQPNPLQSGEDMIELAQEYLDLTGNAFILKVRNGAGRVAELWMLDPRYITVQASKENVIGAYLYAPDTARYTLAVGDVMHLKYPNPKDPYYYGASPLVAAGYEVDIDTLSKQHQVVFFKNNPNPRMAIESKTYLTPFQKDRLWESIKGNHTGAGAGKPFLLDLGASVKMLNTQPTEIDYINTRKNIRDEIITVYGVPASILGISEDVNRANAEAAYFTYAKYTLDPLAKRWDGWLTAYLASEFDSSLIVTHDSLIPSDRSADRDDTRMLLEMGVTTINEERTYRGWTPVENGDDPLVAMNRIPLSVVLSDGLPIAPSKNGKSRPLSLPDEYVDAPAASSKDKNRSKIPLLFNDLSEADEAIVRAAQWRSINAMTAPWERRFERAMKRYFSAQYADVKSRLKSIPPQSPLVQEGTQKALTVPGISFDLDTWNNALKDLFTDEMMKILPDAWDYAMAQVDADVPFTATRQGVQQLMQDSLSRVKDINQTTLDALETALTEGLDAGEPVSKLTDRVLGVFTDASRYRAQMIAQTTVTQTSNKGMDSAWRRESQRISGRIWLSSRDGKVRDAHANADGQEQAIGTPFVVGGDELQYPGDPAGRAENIIRCRCYMSVRVRRN